MREPEMMTAHAAQTGNSHVAAGEQGQDAAASARLPGPAPAALIAVADGAGSSPRGGEGAKAAVETAMKTALRELKTPLAPNAAEALRMAAEDARAALVNLSEESGEPLSHYHATLLIACAGPSWAACTHTGDGCAVIAADGGTNILLSAPEQGEYANETTFLTASNWPQGLRTNYAYAPRHRALVIMTDGLQRVALDYQRGERTPHGPFFDTVARWLAKAKDEGEAAQGLEAMLARATKENRTQDDVSIAVVWPRT